MSIIAENRKARFDYIIEETIEAGIKLLGFEAKSAKHGKLELAGSYVIIRGGEAWLINSKIAPEQPKNAPADSDPSRIRKLLLNKKEISHLSGLLDQKTYSAVALSARIKKNLVKIEIGVGRSKKKSDKRESIKKREVLREIRKRV